MGASKSTMDAQGNQGISRRGFLRGVGLAGLAAGGLCTATAVAAATGSADAAYAEESAATVGNELIEIYGENVNLMPLMGLNGMSLRVLWASSPGKSAQTR